MVVAVYGIPFAHSSRSSPSMRDLAGACVVRSDLRCAGLHLRSLLALLEPRSHGLLAAR